MFISPSWQSPDIQHKLQSAEGIGVTGKYEVHTDYCERTECVAKFTDLNSALAFSSVISWYLDIPEITGLIDDT